MWKEDIELKPYRSVANAKDRSVSQERSLHREGIRFLD